MIRNFIESDIEAINVLGNRLTSNFSKTNNLLEMKTNSFTKILVFEEKNTVRGFLMYTELNETADIIELIVQEEYRGRNIATCLLDYMISDLNDSVKLITLEVRKSNKIAIQLYQKFGFQIVHIRKRYYGDGEDAYLMGRRLER